MKSQLIYFSVFIMLMSPCRNNITQERLVGQKQFGDRNENEQVAELQKQIQEIISAAKGRVGVAAVVLETGKSISFDPHGQFPMQSVYKLPISMAVLKQAQDGKIKLEQEIAVTKSDFVRRGQVSPIRDQNPNGAEMSVSDLLRYAI